ncbi:MAG: hypothetical protein EOO19_13775 [Chryseobacterium sp.]|nr:MAG: hypothetical protein EOO19_13775 [Chryseobacterium sp.]
MSALGGSMNDVVLTGLAKQLVVAEILNEEDQLILDPCIEKTEWFPLNGENPFELPIDQRVFELAKSKFL